MPTINMRRALNEALLEELKRDEKVFLLGEDIGQQGGTFAVTKGLYDLFGGWRVKDTPLSEEGLIGLAVGASLAGYRPVAEIMFMDFIVMAMDQVCNQAAKTRYVYGGRVKLPLVVRCLCGTGLGAGTHHSQSLEAWFAHTPGLKVVYPSTPYDAKGLLKSAIRDDNPVIFMEHKGLLPGKGEVPEEEYTVPIGKADVKREGSDATVIAVGMMVKTALAAADSLAQKGVALEVLDPRTIFPVDTDAILKSVKKTGHAVIVHEAPKTCGFGAELSAIIAEECIEYLDGPVKRLGFPHMPIPFGASEKMFLPTEADIISAVEETLA